MICISIASSTFSTVSKHHRQGHISVGPSASASYLPSPTATEIPSPLRAKLLVTVRFIISLQREAPYRLLPHRTRNRSRLVQAALISNQLRGGDTLRPGTEGVVAGQVRLEMAEVGDHAVGNGVEVAAVPDGRAVLALGVQGVVGGVAVGVVEILALTELVGVAGEAPVDGVGVGSAGGGGVVSREDLPTAMALGSDTGDVADAEVLLRAVGEYFDGVDAVGRAFGDMPARLWGLVVSDVLETRAVSTYYHMDGQAEDHH